MYTVTLNPKPETPNVKPLHHVSEVAKVALGPPNFLASFARREAQTTKTSEGDTAVKQCLVRVYHRDPWWARGEGGTGPYFLK